MPDPATRPDLPSHIRERIVGVDREVPLMDGTRRTYINFDNAASTPVLRDVQATVDEFLGWYSSVHRGSGFKSQVATRAYEQARHVVAEFTGADLREYTVIFGKNTTEATNLLAHRIPFGPGDVILVSTMEHHSNDLPFRPEARVVHVACDALGRLDEDDFDRQLAAHAGRVRLVAITGGSNVTGFITPARRLARKAHAAGAQILIDCAQLAAHRPISVGALDDPEHYDFVAISAHKMYAPFGSGALVARRDMLSTGDPALSGGGTVEIVTVDTVEWAETPERDEAGSPNVVGAVAFAAACRALMAIGMENIAAHEAELTAYALERLPAVPGLRLFGDPDPARARERLGVIPFNIGDISHFFVAAVLSAEHGIAVRNGCFCAHPYVLHLLGLDHEQAEEVRRQMRAHDRRHMPGMVRASFGMYNTREEVDAFVRALTCIARGEIRGRYVQDRVSGDYRPAEWQPDLDDYFRL